MKFYQINKKKAFVFGAFLLLPLSVSAQYLWQEDVDPGELDLGKDSLQCGDAGFFLQG